MKAGIYKTPNDNLVYVAKDRTILATTLSPSCWPGNKVATLNKEKFVAFFGLTAERVCGVPNGCTDPDSYIDYVQLAVDHNIDPSTLIGMTEKQRAEWAGLVISVNYPSEYAAAADDEDFSIEIPGVDLDGIDESHTDEELRRHVVDGEPLPDVSHRANEIYETAYVGERMIGLPRALGAPFSGGPANVHNLPRMGEAGTEETLRREVYDKASRHANNVISGAAAMLQQINAADVEARLYGTLANLEAEGVVQILQDEVIIVDRKRWQEAWEKRWPEADGRSTQYDPTEHESHILAHYAKVREELAASQKRYRLRFCNKQSARKHRKQGHRVWWDADRGMYAWTAN